MEWFGGCCFASNQPIPPPPNCTAAHISLTSQVEGKEQFMGKLNAILSIILLVINVVNGQSIKLDWAKQNTGSNDNVVNDMAMDTAGNLYLTGYFTDTVDFDPGPDTLALISRGDKDVFVQKLSPAGDLVWVKQMGGTGADVGMAIAVDLAGNVYTAGSFVGVVDFNPGSATNNQTSAGGSQDAFVQKLNAAGNYVWAYKIGNTNVDIANDLVADAAGNVYVTGTFIGTVDFNPGGGIANLISSGSTFPDIFIQKVSTTSAYQWAKKVGGTGFDETFGIALDPLGNNLYTTGYFSNTVDFDPGPGPDTLYAAPSRDAFVHKLTSAGNHVWAKQLDGSLFTSQGKAITVDALDNVYVTGYFSATVDFDPSLTDTLLFTSAGGEDPFILKLDAMGNLAWAAQLAGISSNEGTSIAVDKDGYVYTAGFFANVVDFDPDTNVSTLSTLNNNWDVYAQKLDSLGRLVWAKNMGNTGADQGNAILVDTLGNVYLAGSFSDTVDFDIQGTAFEITSGGGLDGFVVKYNTCTVTYATLDTTTCYAFTSPSGITYTSSGTYREAFTNSLGCDSIVTINLAINDTARETITQVFCGSFTLNSETYDTSGTYTQLFTSAAGCDSILTLVLTIKNQPDATVVQLGDTLTATDTLALYQWVDCSDYSPIANATRARFVPTVTGDYALITTANGCSDTSACYNVVITISGISDAFGERFNLYPNPTLGVVNIDLGAFYGELSVTISNLAGQTVLEQQVANTDNLSLSLDAPAGMYLVTLTNKQGQKRVLKLVKE